MAWLAQRGRWLSYSVGMVITEAIHEHVLKIPASVWTPAVESDGEVRDGAWVAELTGDLLDGWPQGIRLIVRKERPHPGAQLRITDADGMRITCFATNTLNRPIAQLELRHRLRARAEDRSRAARATGLRNLPLHDTAQNSIWLEIALDLLAWMPMLALTGRAASGNPAACDSACSPRPASSSPPADAGSSALPAIGPGPARSQTPLNGSHPCQTLAETSGLTCPYKRTCQPGAVEPGVHPRRHPGPQPARPQLPTTKWAPDSASGPSRKIEVRQHSLPLHHCPACP